MNQTHNQEEQHLNYKIYLPEAFRKFIESQFYAKISEKAQLKNLKNDPSFLKNPAKHIALYSDHGTVHVRDVAHQTLEVIQRVNGILIPERNYSDLEFVRAYGLHLAYLHDIGMMDFSDFGRFMHPEFAAQYVFQPEFDAMLELLWQENSGNIPWQLLSLFKNDYSETRIKIIFREILALSVGHSKSKMPIAILNEPKQLRKHIQHILSSPLEALFLQQKIGKFQRQIEGTTKEKEVQKLQKKIEKFQKKLNKAPSEASIELGRYYDNFEKEAYDWLLSKRKPVRRFVINILDSLRCLRAADALRQRGTVLRTSAGYEIFVDQKSANAIYALRSADNEELYLLESKKPINAGEANLASSELDKDGNLRVSFHRGAFQNPKITQKAAYNAAITIDDIQADTLQSFIRNTALDHTVFPAPKKASEAIKISIEGVDDNENFANLVCDTLRKLSPGITDRLQTTISLQGAELKEVRRYLNGTDLRMRFKTNKSLKKILEKIPTSSLNMSTVDWDAALKDIRVVKLSAGEMLIQSGSPSGFVYIPLNNGLKVFPLGGYESTPAPMGVPIGNTGVIRGSVRNANVFAEKNLELLIIPKETYLNYWYTPHSSATLSTCWSD